MAFGCSTQITRAEALSVVAKLKPQLQSQFGVSALALFGSAARDELHVGSDSDVLVKFDAPATCLRYFGVQFAIEDALGMPVDLVTQNALSEALRLFVEQDQIRVLTVMAALHRRHASVCAPRDALYRRIRSGALCRERAQLRRDVKECRADRRGCEPNARGDSRDDVANPMTRNYHGSKPSRAWISRS